MQCAQLRTQLQSVLLPPDLDVGLVVVSPMRRTLQTALLSLDWLLDSGVPFRAHAGWQEISAKPCDTGSPLPELEREFPQVDFSGVDPVFPAKTGVYRYTREAVVGRGRACLEELARGREKAVVVVSHSGFLAQGMTGWGYANADYRVFEFREAAGGGWGLEQWEVTGKGGLGLSPDVAITVGQGIPEEDVVEPPSAA